MFLIPLAFYIVPAISDIHRDNISLKDTKDRIGVAQIFDYKISEKERLYYTPDIVWGANKAWVNSFSTYYIPYDRDPDKERNFEWYKKNYPDKVIYKCDMKTPANSFKYDYGYLTPINISDREIVDYIFDREIKKAIDSGYDAIALDNVYSSNKFHRCGIFKNRKWIRLYSDEYNDPIYDKSVLDHITFLREKINKAGLKLAINIAYEDNNLYKKISRIADIIVDESGFSRKCRPIESGKIWRLRINSLAKNAENKGVVIIDQTCEKESDINGENIQWTIANYLLVRGGSTYLSISGESYGGKNNLISFQKNIGLAKESMQPIGVGYKREYTKGIVIANYSTTDNLYYNLEKSEDYVDYLRNKNTSNPIIIGPLQSIILHKN